VEKGFGSYLTVFNNFRKGFGGLFFFFYSVSSFLYLVEKGFGSYLTVFNNFRKGFGGLFFFFYSVSSFLYLLSSRSATLLFLPCF